MKSIVAVEINLFSQYCSWSIRFSRSFGWNMQFSSYLHQPSGAAHLPLGFFNPNCSSSHTAGPCVRLLFTCCFTLDLCGARKHNTVLFCLQLSIHILLLLYVNNIDEHNIHKHQALLLWLQLCTTSVVLLHHMHNVHEFDSEKDKKKPSYTHHTHTNEWYLW